MLEEALRKRVALANRHPKQRVDLRLLRRILKTLLEELLGQTEFDLGIYLVDAKEMTGLNEGFLRHRGPTDVIAFDYRSAGSNKAGLWGEICVCLDQTVRQARRFHTTWQSELVRYIVHGLLHLQGYSDQKVEARRKMKREEDRLASELSERFAFNKLAAR